MDITITTPSNHSARQDGAHQDGALQDGAATTGLTEEAIADLLAERGPWFSGFCGTGPCRDGATTNKVGEPIRHCQRLYVNGVRAAHPYVLCACACHSADTLPDLAGYHAAHRPRS